MLRSIYTLLTSYFPERRLPVSPRCRIPDILITPLRRALAFVAHCGQVVQALTVEAYNFICPTVSITSLMQTTTITASDVNGCWRTVVLHCRAGRAAEWRPTWLRPLITPRLVRCSPGVQLRRRRCRLARVEVIAAERYTARRNRAARRYFSARDVFKLSCKKRPLHRCGISTF